MSLLSTIQSAITAATPWLASMALVFALMALGARIVERGIRCETIQKFKRLGLLWQIAIVLSVGSATRWAGAKGDRNAPMQPSEPPQVVEPSIAPVAVYTNGVSFVSATSNAVELTTWRTIGGTEMGTWIESLTNAPFFAIGTNTISRAYASASGAISFESIRRPPVGVVLPDGTDLPVLCPLRIPLGFVPEANWHQLVGQDLQDFQDFPTTNNPVNPVNPVQNPRFWHDALPDGGRVFTWENALVDRLPNRRVSMQVEMRPTGDCVFRYDFQEALDTPATNFIIGAQMGTNGVNALSILGTNILSATVWNVDGAPVTNGVAIADLLCTNGVLRTPATFEIRWRNTTGLDSVTDSDGDGLTDWEEVFVWNTYPDIADTDGDGLTDGGEVGGGTNPLDADENGDGFPDGFSADAWGANTLWVTNAPDGSGTVTITLNEPIPTSTSATLVVGDLCIPLRSPSSWNLCLNPGQIYPYRLVVNGRGAADLSITAVPQNPTRGVGEGDTPLWSEGNGGVFDRPSGGGNGNIAIPKIDFTWTVPEGAAHFHGGSLCLHGASQVNLRPTILPAAIGAEWVLDNLQAIGGGVFRLSVENDGEIHTGTATLVAGKLREGILSRSFSAHQCDGGVEDPFCSVCNCYGHQDADLDIHPRTLTLKHDNQAAFTLSHPNSPDVTYTDVRFEICQPGYGDWQAIAGNRWTARIAGTFLVRALATADGEPIIVGPVTVWVRFPSETEMMADPVIQAHATNLWAQTLALCTPTNRHEVGCWIRLDTSTGTYSFMDTIIGPPTPNNDNSYILLGTPPIDSPLFPNLQHGSAVYTVSALHTHTPTTYRDPGDPRIAGPSQDDQQTSHSLQMPCIVFDYEKPNNMTNGIPMGHPLNAPARLYPTEICPRRMRQ